MGVSLERHGDRALAVVPIRLAPDASLDPATVRRRAIAWEREAERAWSGQVALQVSGQHDDGGGGPRRWIQPHVEVERQRRHPGDLQRHLA